MFANKNDVASDSIPGTSPSTSFNAKVEDVQAPPATAGHTQLLSKKGLIIFIITLSVFILGTSVAAYYMWNPTASTNSVLIETPFPSSVAETPLPVVVDQAVPVKYAFTIPIDCSDQAVKDPEIPNSMLEQICDFPENTMTRKFADGKSGECRFTEQGANHVFLYSNGKYLYNWLNQDDSNEVDGKAYQNNLTYAWTGNLDPAITLETDDMTAIHSVPVIMFDSEELFQSSCVERLVSDDELSPPERNWHDAYELRNGFEDTTN